MLADGSIVLIANPVQLAQRARIAPAVKATMAPQAAAAVEPDLKSAAPIKLQEQACHTRAHGAIPPRSH